MTSDTERSPHRQGGPDPRHTFLRRNVLREWSSTADVLAVKEIIDRHLPQLKPAESDETAPCKRARRELLLKFFYGSAVEERVLMPVRVESLPQSDASEDPRRSVRFRSESFQDLSELLQRLRSDADPRGILLEGCSGAGKTVAQRKALFDCSWFVSRTVRSEPRSHVVDDRRSIGGGDLDSAASATEPLLAGYIPCLARLGAPLPTVDKLRRCFGNKKKFLRELEALDSEAVLELLAASTESAFMAANPSEQLRPSWRRLRGLVRKRLQVGPPILIFVDLNAAEVVERQVLSVALKKFQATFGSLGHRVVAAYRSAAVADGIRRRLGADEQIDKFRRFDLRPLTPRDADLYLEAYLAFEKREIEARGGTPPERVADLKSVRGLIAQHVRSGESLLSTPLLMHWVTMLDGGVLRPEMPLSELYERVVELYLDREQASARRPLVYDDETWRNLMLVAMTRLALMMNAAGANESRVGEQAFLTALDNPRSGDPKNIGQAAQRSWWLPRYFRKGSSYYADGIDKDVAVAILESGLFRRERGAIGFVHDSFRYFFLAVYALHRFNGITRASTIEPGGAMSQMFAGLPKSWFSEVAELFAQRPEDWVWPAEFLGGTLDDEQVTAMVFALALYSSTDGLPKLLLRIVQGCGRSDPTAALLQEAHFHRPWAALREPRFLLSEIHACLLSAPGSGPILAEELAHRARWRHPPRPWLRLLQPLRRSSVQTMDLHRATVRAVAVRTAQDEFGCIASAGDDGIVRLWNPESGRIREMAGHTGSVRALAAYPGGRIVSAGDDGIVRLWDPAREDRGLEAVQTIAAHTRPVRTLAVLLDGRIASAGDDCTVKLWNPDLGTGPDALRTIAENLLGSTYAVAALSDGRVVTAGDDLTVSVWGTNLVKPDPSAHQITHRHTVLIKGLAVLSDDRIVLAGYDGTVTLWNPHPLEGEPDVRTMQDHRGPVNAVAVLTNDCIVSAGADGTVKLWDPNLGDGGPQAVRTMAEHDNAVNHLAVLKNDRIVSSSLETVKLWDPAAGDGSSAVQTMAEHTRVVRALAALPDGRIVSAGFDHTVKLWNAAQGNDPWTTAPSRASFFKRVRIVAIYSDGRIASAGDDGIVRLHDLARRVRRSEGVTTAAVHKGMVRALAVLRDGRIVSASEDGTVKLWNPAQGTGTDAILTVTENPLSRIHAVAGLSDGRVVTGGDDHTVSLWRTDRESREPPARRIAHRHTSFITSLAVLSEDRIVSVSYDGTVKLWDPHRIDGELEVRTMRTTTDSRRTLLAAHLYGRFVSAEDDGTVLLWDPNRSAERSEVVRTVIKHSGAVNALAIFPDGRIVSAGDDKRICVSSPDGDPVLMFYAGEIVLSLAACAERDEITAVLASGDLLRLAVDSGRPIVP